MTNQTTCSKPGFHIGRDLSPSNLLLAESPQGDSAPELKVADFGLSACCGVSSMAGNENYEGVGQIEERVLLLLFVGISI